MGREVVEPPTPPADTSTSSEPGTPLSHNEALARVRQTITDLAEDLSEVDRYENILLVWPVGQEQGFQTTVECDWSC